MNVEIGAEAAQFPEKEYTNGTAVAVHGWTCTWWRQNGFHLILVYSFSCLIPDQIVVNIPFPKTVVNHAENLKVAFALKVPKGEIFDLSDFLDFYTIKSLRVGDFGVKIKNF